MEEKRESIGRQRPVTIVGAGFSGLVSAFHLVRAGFRVEVIESKSRAGGLIETLELPHGRVETAANGLLNSVHVEELFSAIGLSIQPTLKTARKRFIFRNGKPRRWPLGLGATLGLFGFLFNFLFMRKKVSPQEGETVQSWGSRALGKEASEYTIETALQGIYAGDASRMSARLIVGRMFGIKNSGVVAPPPSKAKPAIRGTVSAPNGMGELIKRLRSYLELQGVTFKFSETFDFMAPSAHSDFAAREGSVPRLDHPVIVATSCESAERLLREIDPERAAVLAKIELLPVVTSTVFYKESLGETQGFGCLFPPVENRRALGVLMNNFTFDHRVSEGYSENWILGGACGTKAVPQLFQMTDQEILNLIDEERVACFGAQSNRLSHEITRWERALPHYTVELEKALPDLAGTRQNVVLVGNYLGQIGLAKILERASLLPEELHQTGSWK